MIVVIKNVLNKNKQDQPGTGNERISVQSDSIV